MKLCPTCLHCYEDDIAFCTVETHDALTSPRSGSCVIAEKYRLIRRLGYGGMGAVYEGTHLELNRPLAVKILVPEYASADPQARLRLRQEALTACNFDHPNLVRLYDFGTNVTSVEENGRVHVYDELYIVMELLRGQSLKDLLQSTPIELNQAVRIGIQIAEGLAEIHSQGIIYRDLKPANILICSDYKGDLLVKIVDFGAVKMLKKSANDGALDLTKAMFVGSPLYASPENCKAEQLDERSDIYSLGLILYEMIAGVRAFEDGDFLTLLNNHAYAPPPPLNKIPDRLVNLTMRALRKNPNERPQTAADFVEDLRSLGAFDSTPGLPDQSNELIATSIPATLNKDTDDNDETVVSDRRNRQFWAVTDSASDVVADRKAENSTRSPAFIKVQIPVTRARLKSFGGRRKPSVVMISLACLAQTGTLPFKASRTERNATAATLSEPQIAQPSPPNPLKREENRPPDRKSLSTENMFGADKRSRTSPQLDPWLKSLLNSNNTLTLPKLQPYAHVPRKKPAEKLTPEPSVIRRILATSPKPAKTYELHPHGKRKDQGGTLSANNSYRRASRDKRPQNGKMSSSRFHNSAKNSSRRRR